MNNRYLVLILFVFSLILVGLNFFPCKSHKNKVHYGKNVVEILARNFLIDKQYESMKGPHV